MREYIDRDATLNERPGGRNPGQVGKEEYNKGWNDCRSAFYKCITSMPAADVVEVRHGRWMTTDAYPHHLYCSVCYKTYAKNAKWVNELDLPTNYCPNCGARMGKEDEHEAD